MDSDIQKIIDSMIESSPQWKVGKLAVHLEKRKRQGQIPQDWTAEDYNNFIVEIVTNPEVEVYRYWLPNFQQSYFVFGLPKWIVIVGEDGIMETAFEIDREDYYSYLNPKAGYVRVK